MKYTSSHKSKFGGYFITATLMSTVLNPATADWAQTLGIGQKSTNLGLAVTATADDFDVFYTNPSGAANFDRTFIGFGLKTMDNRTLDIKQSGTGQIPSSDEITYFSEEETTLADLDEPAREGLDISPEKTLEDESIAFIWAGAGYTPVDSIEGLVVGIGMGVPFDLSSNYSNDNAVGNYGKFSARETAIIVVETTPTIAYKVNDRLNIGASLGITTAKYFRLQSDLPALSGTGSLISMDLETSSDTNLPAAPWQYQSSPYNLSYTLGIQYKIDPKLSFGLTYRSETPETFSGEIDVTFHRFTPNILGSTDSIGPYHFKDNFEYEAELPRHIQAGIAYNATPDWKLMGDIRWTNWSSAKGFGSPTKINLTDGTVDIGTTIANDPSPTASLVSIFNPMPNSPMSSLTIDYKAEDTVSIHLGASWKMTPTLELQAGYIFDPSFMPDAYVDLTTLSSDRHIYSFGGTYTKPTNEGEWGITLGAQIIDFQSRHVAKNEAQNSSVNYQDGTSNTTNPKALGGYDIGGYAWSVGCSISYKFGGPSKL